MSARVSAANVKLKRAYEPPSAEDGTRVLVDRLWPRGVSKQKASLDRWMKEIAPSTELRKWLAHDPEQGRNFAAATPKRFASTLICLPSSGPWRGIIR